MKIVTTILTLCVVSVTAFGGANKAEHTGHAMTMTKSEIPEQETVNDSSLAIQKTCPIMEGEIDSTLYVDQEVKRIYVCCNGCLETVQNDFAAAEKKLNDLGQKPESVQKK